MTFLSRALRCLDYFSIGVLAIIIALVSLAFDLQSHLIEAEFRFVWQVVTGLVLLGGMGHQWYLMYLKWIGRARRREVQWHRWLGVGVIALFVMHAVRLGHLWMTALTIVFILTALTGVFNKEVLQFRHRWMYLAWFAAHVGLSIILAPLIVVHIWIALIYQ